MHGQEAGNTLGIPYHQAGYVSDTSAYTESMLQSAAGAVVGKPPRSAPTTPRYAKLDICDV